MATDLDLVRALRPDDVAPTEAFLAEERERLTVLLAGAGPTMTPAAPAPVRPRRSRRRRWVALPVAALLVGATAVYAATRQDGAEPIRVACQFDAGTTSVVDAVSDDPIDDCRALWAATHDGAAPELRAFRVGSSVLVLRADADPPAGAVALDQASSRSTVNRAAELDAWLHDYATGLWAQPCLPYDLTVTEVQSLLDELGIADTWIVRPEPPATTDACGLGFLDPATSTVVVRGVDAARWTAERTSPPEEANRILGHAVADAVGTGCLTADQATRRARSVAETLGYPEANVRTIVDPRADCSRVRVTVAGLVNITVYGPAD